MTNDCTESGNRGAGTGAWTDCECWDGCDRVWMMTAVSYNGSPTSSHVGVCDLHRHRRCMFHGRCTRPSATVPSPLPLQKSGTCCRRRSRHCRHWRHSSVHCSVDHTATHTTGNSSIDTSVTRDTQRPWSFVRLASRWNSLMMMMMMNVFSVAWSNVKQANWLASIWLLYFTKGLANKSLEWLLWLHR